MASKFKTFFVFLGDLAALYGSLAIALLIRYGNAEFGKAFGKHVIPFTLIFVFWILIYYLIDFYEIKNLKNDIAFFRSFFVSLVINVVIAIIFFYVLPFYGITPKTNLLIFIVVFTAIELVWRYSFNSLNAKFSPPENVLLIDSGQNNGFAEELINHLNKNPQLSYKIAVHIKDGAENYDAEKFSQLIKTNSIETVIIPTHLEHQIKFSKIIYKNISSEINVMNFAEFYELIFKKVPLCELEEAWFLENLLKKGSSYDPIKSLIDFILSLIAFVIFLPFTIIIAVSTKVTSKGPIIYKQERTGKNENPFMLYKFRTMIVGAEKNGAQWSQPGDSRITKFGKILRYTHLDELPQLINVLKGNVSFVGPRPERPEFVGKLKEQIPYYEIRHLVKPGITGWAQINYRYGASVEDAIEKLQYDIYYLKNKSMLLDLLIVLKTIKLFFVNLK